MNDRRVDSIRIRGDGRRVGHTTSGSEDRNCIVWRTVCEDTHRDEHDQEIDKHGSICQYAVLLKCADLAKCKTKDRPNQTADCVAELEFSDLRKRLAIADDNDTHGYQQLEALQKVDNVSQWATPNTECQIAVILGGKLVRVEAKETGPQEPAGTSSRVRAE
jgi:hypothetical protein